jgi:hypothetical protein
MSKTILSSIVVLNTKVITKKMLLLLFFNKYTPPNIAPNNDVNSKGIPIKTVYHAYWRFTSLLVEYFHFVRTIKNKTLNTNVIADNT